MNVADSVALFTQLHRIEQNQFRLERKIDHLQRSLDMSTSQTDQNFANLEAQVHANTDVEASAATLLAGLAAQLDAAIAAANNGDSSALPALQQQLKGSADSLAAAVAANTRPAPGSAPPTGNTP